MDQRPLKKELQSLRMPDAIKHLPRDERGFPIPWFVAIDARGVPDFRVIRAGGVVEAYRRRTCWLCGGQLGTAKYAFPIGPMCAVNRVNSEPASHRGCAIFAAQACPFLSNPRMRRNDKDLPEDGQEAAGIHIDRNPGVVCIWITKHYKPFSAGNGVLFELGEPDDVLWFCEGRPATRDEVLASVTKGLPLLEAMAKQESVDSVAALHRQVARFRPLLPPIKRAA